MYLEHKDLSKYWVIDIETDDLDASLIWCAVCYNVLSEEFVVHRDAASFRSWIQEHSDAVFCGHNAISFDIPVLRRLWKAEISDENVIDTLILSYLYHPNIPRPEGLKGKAGPHSLEAWGLRFKFLKGDFHDFSRYSEEMLRYCIQDCRLTRRLFLALTERMRQRGFSELSCWIEHRVRVLLDRQQSNGFYFDVEKAKALRDSLREEEKSYEGLIRELFPRRLRPVRTYEYRVKHDGQPYSSYFKHLEQYPDVKIQKINETESIYHVYDWEEFNVGSPSQRVSRLLEFGWKPTKFTKPSKTHPKGQPQADEDSIVKLAEESSEPAIRAIADWLVVNGRANMLDTWMGSYNSDTHCIHGRVFSCGASTRRMTHNSPNTANIPKAAEKVKYGKEVRQLWMARPGRVLVGVDGASMQMRLFAHYLESDEAIKLYCFGKPHQHNADAIGRGVDYDGAKKAYYSFILGAGALRLGTDAGGDESLGRHIKKTLKKVTPGLRELIEELESIWEKTGGWLPCLDGGWVRCPSKHMVLCYMIQPAEAIVMKLALTIFFEEADKEGWDVILVGNIHDEWQFDCAIEDAEKVGQAAVKAIIEAGKRLELKAPMDGEYHIGGSWAETH